MFELLLNNLLLVNRAGNLVNECVVSFSFTLLNLPPSAQHQMLVSKIGKKKLGRKKW